MSARKVTLLTVEFAGACASDQRSIAAMGREASCMLPVEGIYGDRSHGAQGTAAMLDWTFGLCHDGI
jgi:hypothetical protein